MYFHEKKNVAIKAGNVYMNQLSLVDILVEAANYKEVSFPPPNSLAEDSRRMVDSYKKLANSTLKSANRKPFSRICHLSQQVDLSPSLSLFLYNVLMPCSTKAST